MIVLLILSIVFAVIDWIAVIRENRRLEYVAKPATLLLLCIWFGAEAMTTSPIPKLALWFLIGLVFSLGGDVFLMLPGNHFIKGLLSFLVAHIAYVVAFNLGGFILNTTSLAIALLIVIVAALILRRLIASLREKGRGSLVGPIVVYAVVLCLTLWSTVTTTLRPEWLPYAGWIAMAGGVLFFTSDVANAWNRFVGPHFGGRIFEMVTYHLAQYALSIGVLLSLGVIGS
jgi:uncharacterized membrane protein YhhN